VTLKLNINISPSTHRPLVRRLNDAHSDELSPEVYQYRCYRWLYISLGL